MKDLEELKSEANLRDYAEKNLEKSKHGLYCCPLCGSGTRTGSGALSITNRLWKCFACDAGGSIVDLIMAKEGLSLSDAVKRLVKNYGKEKAEPQENIKNKTNPRKSQIATTLLAKPKQDYTAYYKTCHDRIKETDYPQKRGIEPRTINRFNIGYDPAWVSPTATRKWEEKNRERKEKGQRLLSPLKPSPRLIIPLSKYNYLARETRPDNELTERQKTYKKMNEGKDKPFFNLNAMENKSYFFVVEGEIDAISIEQAGGSCIALGSAAKARTFGKLLQASGNKKATVIISLDNDAIGIKSTETIVNVCKTAGIDYLTENASGKYKDPNEFLVKEKYAFYALIHNIIKKVKNKK